MNTDGETWLARGRASAQDRPWLELPLSAPSTFERLLWPLLQSAHAAGDARSVLSHQVLVCVVVAGEHAHHGTDGHVGLRWSRGTVKVIKVSDFGSQLRQNN